MDYTAAVWMIIQRSLLDYTAAVGDDHLEVIAGLYCCCWR